MKIHQRLFEIKTIIEKKGGIKITELSKIFNVDKRIIRRDLNILKELNYIERFHGGAKINDKLKDIYLNNNFEKRMVEHQQEKKKIGEEAAKYIKANDNIFILGGTTTFEMVKNLPRHFSFNVATNFYPIIDCLSKYSNIEIFSTGGLLDKNSKAYFAQHAENIIKFYNIDKLFLGCSGISLEKGLNTYDYKFISLIDRLIESANEVFLLVDSSKFGIERNIFFASIKSINTIITDNKINTKCYNILIKEGLKVIIVDVS